MSIYVCIALRLSVNYLIGDAVSETVYRPMVG
jgi:hypothetical protein